MNKASDCSEALLYVRENMLWALLDVSWTIAQFFDEGDFPLKGNNLFAHYI